MKFGIGTEQCPAFKGLFEYVLLYCAATVTGVDLITEENANVVFNPLGGFHHSSRSAAEGFCYVNDTIVAIDLVLGGGGYDTEAATRAWCRMCGPQPTELTPCRTISRS